MSLIVKLSFNVVVNKPVQAVWNYSNNSDNLIHWLNDFVSHEQVGGSKDAPGLGDTANVTYTQPGGEFTMLEEITEYEAPRHIKLFMTSKHFDMEIVNDFEEIAPDKTRLTASADFVRLGLMMKAVFLFSSKKKMQADHERQINKLKDLIEAT